MNQPLACTTENCDLPAFNFTVSRYCTPCAVAALAAFAEEVSEALRAAAPISGRAERSIEDETRTLYNLIDDEGWSAVDLRRATTVLGRPERTAARRLAEARRWYADEIRQRVTTTDLDN
jgi:hypothetical protein